MTTREPDAETVARVLSTVVTQTGLVYSDRTRERVGDYVTLARLPFRSLVLDLTSDFASAPSAVKLAIWKSAGDLAAKRGERYEVSASGQTVILGF